MGDCPRGVIGLFSGGVLIFFFVFAFLAALWLDTRREGEDVDTNRTTSPPAVAGSVERQQAVRSAPTADSPCAAPVEIALSPGIRTEIPLQDGCAWSVAGSSQYGNFLRNDQSCLIYEAIGEDGVVVPKSNGVCPEGSASAYFTPGWHIKKLFAVSRVGYVVNLQVKYPHE